MEFLERNILDIETYCFEKLSYFKSIFCYAVE
jgi:hypothetical protein